MKVSDIDKKYQDSMRDYQLLIEKEATAKKDAERLKEEAEAAAVAGDLEGYKTLKAKASDAEALAYVLQKKVEKSGASDVFTRDEIDKAWKDYAGDYNKTLKAKLKKFADAKEDLLQLYSEMVTLQRDACAVRERMAKYAGIALQGAVMDKGIGDAFPMEYIPCVKSGDFGEMDITGTNRVHDPDACYYLSAHAVKNEISWANLATSPEVVRVTDTVVYHQA